ncbi:hypothetical protein BDV38DRAFT_277329 [Aspergillus pseudotamarii]|uniref:DUF1754-domain-containing protein n=1 Tax=Aspergillus pseudotamarii TaxID=132259 RepID=A0A5N6TAE9_ASPPS|nr:uncharacterized protein BDV38DRAFT_277329 [Aspergillus pseudotamarii]KAE8143303.1 hypothetical protein BDV38DRAFT_277329 [Aspergillus pseudotamarii]
MPADEYSVGGGGKLKLKGSKVSDGRIEKKKKKAKKSNPETGSKKESEDAPPPASTSQAADEKESSTSLPQPDESDAGVGVVAAGKTEAEKKHEEMRKKRLQERLKREGVKTHKERVEELNKYLSRLSEHHDMPKIGPG